MFSLIAFFENVDTSTIANVAALKDTKYTTTGDDFRVPETFNQIFAVYNLANLTTRARLTSPSLLKKAPYEVRPLDSNTEPASDPPINDLRNNPIQLTSAEALNAETTTGTTAVDQYVLVWLSDGNIQPEKSNDEFTIRATGTDTATADAWTNASMTLGSDLDPGTYAIVGFRAEGATMIAARLIFTRDEARPGVIAFDAATDKEPMMFRHGNLGIWGTFKHDTPPKVEILCGAGDTAQTYALDLIKVS